MSGGVEEVVAAPAPAAARGGASKGAQSRCRGRRRKCSDYRSLHPRSPTHLRSVKVEKRRG